VDTPAPLPKHPDLMTREELSRWVQRLVDDQVAEGLLLDYKAKPYDLSDQKAKGDLAKDVTS